MSDILKSI